MSTQSRTQGRNNGHTGTTIPPFQPIAYQSSHFLPDSTQLQDNQDRDIIDEHHVLTIPSFQPTTYHSTSQPQHNHTLGRLTAAAAMIQASRCTLLGLSH